MLFIGVWSFLYHETENKLRQMDSSSKRTIVQIVILLRIVFGSMEKPRLMWLETKKRQLTEVASSVTFTAEEPRLGDHSKVSRKFLSGKIICAVNGQLCKSFK